MLLRQRHFLPQEQEPRRAGLPRGVFFLIICHLQTSFLWHEKANPQTGRSEVTSLHGFYMKTPHVVLLGGVAYISNGDVYDTFTIRLSASMEVVVASRINGMTDDFLATLRNAQADRESLSYLDDYALPY